MIDVEEWAEIRRLHRAEGMSVKAIVRKLGVARNTVRAALRSSDAPKYERQGPGSAVDAFEPEIRRLLATTPDMPATVVAERIGWTRGITVLRERVAELRPTYLVPESFGRTEYKAGELAQWDLWFPDYKIPVGHGQAAVLPVLVGVACYSRWTLARMIASKESADVLGGHLGLLVELGAVPRVGVYDGEPAISVRRGQRLIYTRDYLRLKGTLGMGSVVLAKGHPERKGIVERTNGYLETSFLPGRRFDDRDDFNTQLGDWLETTANVRSAFGPALPSVGAHRRGPGRHDGPAPAAAGHGLAPRPAPSRRPLGAPPDQRLLGAPQSRRPSGPRQRRRRPPDRHPGHRCGGPPRPDPGPPRHPHRPCPRSGPGGGPGVGRRPIADADEVEARDLAVYDRVTGAT